MGRINFANLKKTAYYLKRNGLVKTAYAVLERLEERKQPPYEFVPVGEAVLKAQREEASDSSHFPTFSILVPTYRTKEIYLREMIVSLLEQSYPHWELILADATPDESVQEIARTYAEADKRVRYVKLEENAGIAENTNQACGYAKGDYVGLLDHDDLLTPDALYEMQKQIKNAKETGRELQLLYSDEDKCNGDGTEYYEPHFKEKFNLDLLLSNNYICHFMVMKRELIQELRFRSDYDGAQDFDLVLRAAAKLMDSEELIVHIPKVLYHWRCHTGSTAENPRSKLYAYEAGKRAVQDFADRAGWDVVVEDTPHLGFYQIRYNKDIFEVRPDVLAVGGPIVKHGRIVGGRMDEEGDIIYKDLPVRFSGYMHRAELHQDAEILDVRNMRVRPEYAELLEQARRENNTISASIRLCEQLRAKGGRIVYLPEMLRGSDSRNVRS